ncbi:hypothetical protein PDIG_17130 [Penicillium digitatum PHI26]|uniref:Uncharacterized protein n=2 Tax=Penicillium digitatum TaxID=36651 RepID=K9G6F7_PEND2|nr:hypothetical protein PDIP_55040 [Penicillium digitatum Pd1]EKV11710.1 hypothetical protein PDIP_55040 [Penicillium digitatum Pd1]EKV16999.1 hypothetical protein PDIG_17130 [Penicillium digitatum PHI26]
MLPTPGADGRSHGVQATRVPRSSVHKKSTAQT